MKPLLSVVVPCFNEAEVLWETHSRLISALSAIPDLDFEILYVDDGSRDATPDMLREIHAIDSRTRVIRFSRNFGHQTAVTAGLERAGGDAAVLIDADLQDPPEVIADMVARWREGYDVAYGVRTDREGETKFKLATAKAFYRLLNRLSETEIPLDTGDFRLMDRSVINALRSMPERDRFVRGMVAWAGFKQIAVPYRRAARFAGESKYPLFKMLYLAVDGLTSFSRAPLRLATWMGFVVSAVALVAIMYALFMRVFTNDWVTGWTALFIAVLFFGGAQLLSLGIVGEYIGRIYGEAKRRPLYLVQETHGFEHSYEHVAEVSPRSNGRALPNTESIPRRRREDHTRTPYRESNTTVPVYREPASARADESIA
ncbi:MAG TPA: glycosyltransferase family 2 protein [Gemmatimonadaceae bacterium]|nr:glycosyltransferase family 2 protein [Gemmatimonadaceae bacterium]